MRNCCLITIKQHRYEKGEVTSIAKRGKFASACTERGFLLDHWKGLLLNDLGQNSAAFKCTHAPESDQWTIFFEQSSLVVLNSVIAYLFFFDCIFGWFLGPASHINDLSWSTKLKCFRELKNGVSHISVSMTLVQWFLKMEKKGAQLITNPVAFFILLQFSRSALLSSLPYLASAYAPPAQVILHVKPSWQPAALQESGCVQSPQ